MPDTGSFWRLRKQGQVIGACGSHAHVSHGRRPSASAAYARGIVLARLPGAAGRCLRSAPTEGNLHGTRPGQPGNGGHYTTASTVLDLTQMSYFGQNARYETSPLPYSFVFGPERAQIQILTAHGPSVTLARQSSSTHPVRRSTGVCERSPVPGCGTGRHNCSTCFTPAPSNREQSRISFAV